MKVVLSILLLFSFSSFAQDDHESFWEKMARYHDVIQSMVQGSLDNQGPSPEALFKPNLASYDSIRNQILKDIAVSDCQSIECENYHLDFAKITHANLGIAEETRLLPNEKSFELRQELIKNARSSIYILVWAVYDDETGIAFQKQLLEALEINPKLDIRLVVDGNIANLKGRKVLKGLEKKSLGKIKVMKWKSRKYRANGNHRKMIIIDDEHVIVGGMNIGNQYSHLATKDKWRDLDIYLRGHKAGEAASNKYADIWNRQIVEFPKLHDKLGMMSTFEIVGNEPAGSSVVFVDQHPGSAAKEAYHNIHTGMVKLFRNARETIDIENAYFIMDPIIRKELETVVKRGVKVRIFTNSDKSVDETLVSMPVMHSARDAVIMGAKLYLKKGTTLHAKYVVIDKKISVVGSFNFHPRSLRFDAENVAVVFNEAFASQLTSHFEEGIKEAQFFDNPKQFKIDWNLIGLLTQSFYFDFL